MNIRPAINDKADLKFIDGLQKQHSSGLGYWPRRQLEGYIKSGDVYIAESPPACLPDGKMIPGIRGVPLGYIIGRDRYFKREDVGVIYQVAVKQMQQRALIGAMLVQHMFEQAAYGCKLFCCWCAQDLDACHFWEACGFVPLAFRAGSEKKQRIHIFWQKRIRAEENGVCRQTTGETPVPPKPLTPWWFPSMTSGGAIREGRLVIPIPPGTHWSDAKPMVLPELRGLREFADEPTQMTGEADRKPRRKRAPRKAKMTEQQKCISNNGGLWFESPPPVVGGQEQEDSCDAESQPKPKKPKRTYDPRYVQAARDLCARYLEEVQQRPELLEGTAGGNGKYDVSRQLNAAPSPMMEHQISEPMPLLDAA